MSLETKLEAAKTYLIRIALPLNGSHGFIYQDVQISDIDKVTLAKLTNTLPKQVSIAADILVKAGYGLSLKFEHTHQKLGNKIRVFLGPAQFIQYCRKYGIKIAVTELNILCKKNLLFTNNKGINRFSIVLLHEYDTYLRSASIKNYLQGKTISITQQTKQLLSIYKQYEPYITLLDQLESINQQGSSLMYYQKANRSPEAYSLLYTVALRAILSPEQQLLESHSPIPLNKALVSLRDRFANLSLNNNALANQIIEYPFLLADAFDTMKSRLTGDSLYSVFAKEKYDFLNTVIDCLYGEKISLETYLPLGYKYQRRCRICGKIITKAVTGHPKKYCSGACRSAAHRKRRKSQQ